MAWFCRIWDRRFGAQTGYDDAAVFGMYLLRYLITLNNYFFPFSSCCWRSPCVGGRSRSENSCAMT